MNVSLNLVKELNNNLFEMANLSPKRTGLKARIWAEGRGVERNKSDNIPRVKLQIDDKSLSVSIEEHPKILAKSRNIKQTDLAAFKEAINYISRNYDLFLKHYNDITDDFDDEDLFNALRKRGDYK